MSMVQGDNALLLSYDATGQSGELVHVEVGGESITTTPEHPFWVPQKGWTSAIKLRAGDKLSLLNGETVIVKTAQHELLKTPVLVYNFEVEEFHTYFVSGISVLVHNVCAVKENGVRVDVRTSNEHGLPHGHVTGNGPNTTIGLNGAPMPKHPPLSPKQMNVINGNWGAIANAINKYFPKR